MNTEAGLEHCLSFINCQLQSPRGPMAFHSGNHHRAITISRQTGSGGHAIAERLAALLQARCPGTGAPWTVFDMNLVERVLEE
ncbi:MAG: cytidylate kinase family protein, partial [Limisphaerales bacterium]